MNPVIFGHQELANPVPSQAAVVSDSLDRGPLLGAEGDRQYRDRVLSPAPLLQERLYIMLHLVTDQADLCRREQRQAPEANVISLFCRLDLPSFRGLVVSSREGDRRDAATSK